ncbi:putative regulator of Ras-like GTPase activity (Roadblock/LC7/MglB family) [Allocatelliglobosispora scoriae]|uniref:Putative regulator of Ras-like GTPase activity (Roadblock/LC7/MglB family) n=1 Tax=Allocatelliglobosispora scoriae TaxID=643052 RepID=A0A841BQ88_9ACTN|nr:roadblock/LC7 domain-containing protein [Allocatelliglobosispora scoriae]MBB5869538.1 putative regulator of Ras-like GTPase activity (Roadblock/LC7/MglB family) [Allocatelliglobosispora scoriae]
MQPQKTTAELAWLVDELVERVPDVQRAIVLSADGLLMASSSGLTREEADHFAAIAASLHGIARGAGRMFAKGGIRQAIIEMDLGFLFVTAAGNGACLAVIAGAEADAGLIAYEMAMLVARVGKYLTAPVRTAAG